METEQAVAPGQGIRSLGAWRAALGWLLIYAGVFIALAAIHAHNLTVFLFYDDLSHLRIVMDQPWAVCFQPMSNGFWRPVTLLLTKTAFLLGGLSPAPYHLLQLALHAGAVTALLAVLLAVPGFPRAAACAATAAFAVHPVTWETAVMLPNSADAGMTLFMLLAFGVWIRAVHREGGLGACAIFGCAVLLLAAFAAKETAVVAWVPLAAYSFMRRGAPRRERAVALALGAVCLLAGAVAWWRLTGAESYLGESRFDPRVHRVARRYLDYCMSPWIPFLHVMDSPHGQWTLPNSAYHAARLATVVALAAALFVAWRRRAAFAFACLVGIGALYAPPSLLDLPMPIRYVYPGLPLAVAATVGAIAALPAHPRITAAAAGCVYVIYLSAAIWLSPVVHEYRNVAVQLELLTVEMRRVETQWPRGATVVIANHPHPAPEPWKWVYIQHMTAIHVERPDVTVSTEPVPGAFVAYRWDGQHLVEQPEVSTK